MKAAPSRRVVPTPASEPKYGLDPLPSATAKNVFGWLAVTVALAVVLLVIKRSDLVITALVLGSAVAVLAGVQSFRTARRREFLDRYTEAVCPELGSARPLRSMVRASRWTLVRGGWLGFPERLKLRYDNFINAQSPQWIGQILDLTKMRFGVTYQVYKENKTKGVIWLKSMPAVEQVDAAPVPEVVQRAEQIVQKLFPSLVDAEFHQGDDGAVSAIDISFTAGADLSDEIKRYRIDSKIMTPLAGRWRSKWDLKNDTVRYELRKNFEERIPHPPIAPMVDDVIKNYSKVRIPFARDEDHRTITWAPAIEPHFMCVGKTGTGKTVAMHGIVTEFTAQGWPVWVIDGKSTEFIGFRRWGNVQIVGTYISEQVRIIHAFHEEMERRLALVRDELAHEDDFLPMLLAIDEYKAFKFALTMIYKKIRISSGPYKDPTEPEAFGLVSDIAARGRSLRMHLLIGLQRPDAEFLTGDMRDNFPGRLSTGPLSRDGAQMMWNNYRTGTTIQRGKRGRGISTDENGNLVEVQVYWTPDPRKANHEQNQEDLALLESLRPAKIVHPRLRVVDPAPMIDEDKNGNPITLPAGYREWAKAPIVEWTPGDDRQGPPPSIQQITAGVQGMRGAVATGDPDDDIDDELYDPESYVPITELLPGDLVCIEEDSGIWVRVEGSEPDPLDETYQCLDWISDDGEESGSESLPADSHLLTRVQIDHLELEEAA